jgi:hypothetical protein
MLPPNLVPTYNPVICLDPLELLFKQSIDASHVPHKWWGFYCFFLWPVVNSTRNQSVKSAIPGFHPEQHGEENHAGFFAFGR